MKVEATKMKDLWDCMRAGDTIALQELYNSYYQYLFAAGFSICLNRELTKDCIHDTFIGIWSNRNKIPHVNSVGGYLRISVRRKIIDALKKERLLEHTVSSDDYEHEFSYEEVIIAFQTEQKTKKLLEKALSHLTKKQKEVIRLRFFENKNYEEIALLLNSEPRTIYNNMYEAIKQLRSLLASNYTP